MSNISFKINLDDEDGVLQVVEFLQCYLNGSRVKAARDRHPLPDKAPDVDPPLPEPVEEELPPPPEPEVIPENKPDVEVDSAGDPWDPDRHSSAKTKLKDGRWRPRREVKAKEDKPVPPPPSDDAAMAPEEVSYKMMMDTLKGKGLELPAMNTLAKNVGVDSIALLINQPELIPAVLALAEKL